MWEDAGGGIVHLARDSESCKCDVLEVQFIMQKNKGKEGKFKGRSQGYRKMLSEMAILLVGFTKSLLLSYWEELVLSEVDCPCLYQSWVSFQK